MSSKLITPTSEHRARSLSVTRYTSILKHSVCGVVNRIPVSVFQCNIQFRNDPYFSKSAIGVVIGWSWLSRLFSKGTALGPGVDHNCSRVDQ